ncbi:MAG: hypothetical protein IPP73_01875 [Chitinophagaceae bacterium]|nr:hypothetical protein [Chitinophagaceae bacterium]
MKQFLLIILMMFLSVSRLLANNIQVTNVTTVITGNVIQVQFDLSWENSWRTASTNNWDGAWVFLKFKDNDGRWKHLNFTGNNTVLPIGASATFPNADSENGVGMMIFRSSNGFGNVNLLNVRAGIVSYPGTYDIKAFAIEMVHIPQGSYYIGDGSSGFNSNGYYTSTAQQSNFQVTGGGATITLGAGAGNLRDNIDAGASGTLTGFPAGFAAFWMMKYELSQDGWVQFLNCLTFQQQALHVGFNPVSLGAYANFQHGGGSVRISVAGVNNTLPAVFGNDADLDLIFNETNDGQWNVMGGLNWIDMAAWLDWAGLRPMTELEFEKSCRGPLIPVNDEYAWGTVTIASYPYTISNNFQSNSSITNYSSTEGNAISIVTSDTGATFGSIRNGIFANNLSTRVSAGAGYYGAMELSGNVEELCVTTANAAGRSYTGMHGNGALTDSGYANEDYWPGINGNTSATTPNGVFSGSIGVTTPVGTIFRGGSYTGTSVTRFRTSYRVAGNVLSAGSINRISGFGIRGVRNAN